MYKFSIKIPIYECTCHIVISKDIEKVINRYAKIKKWEKESIIEKGEEVHGMATSNGDVKNYYLFYSINSLTVNCLTHEISHTVDEILSDRDIKDGEARAYLVAYISEKIFDYIFKKQLLINKWMNEKPSLPREDNKDPERVQEGLS